MKKILGIIVLGLLLSGCGLADKGPKPKLSEYGNKNSYNYRYQSIATKKPGDRKGTYYGRWLVGGSSKNEARKKSLKNCQDFIEKQSTKLYCSTILWDEKYIAKSKKQNSSSGSKIDPTVWDDLLKMGGVKSGSSTSSSSSSSSTLKSTCYNTGEETGGTNKSCKYSCSGNLYTMTISSLEICPVKIQN